MMLNLTSYKPMIPTHGNRMVDEILLFLPNGSERKVLSLAVSNMAPLSLLSSLEMTKYDYFNFNLVIISKDKCDNWQVHCFG